MKKKYFFSIILPTFNSHDYLRNAINSIISQTFKEWELIIIDNYSSDGTKNLIKSYRDSRIKFFQIRNRGIISKSRNFGIKKSYSKWLCFIDSDDTWHANKLEIVKNYIDQHNYDLFYHNLEFSNKKFFFFKKKIADKNNKLSKPIFKEFIKNGNGIGQSSVVVKKKLIEKIGLTSESNEIFAWSDFDTWLKVSLKTNKFLHIPIVLGSIWVGKTNVSSFNQDIENNKSIVKFYKEKAKRKFKIDLAKTWWIIYPGLLKKFREKKFRECNKILKNIPESPFKFKIRFFYIKYSSLFRLLISKLKKKVNLIILFIFIKSNNNFINSNLKLVKIDKINKFSLLCKKNENFDISKSSRFKNYEKLYLLKDNKKIVSYGWQKNCKKFNISEIEKNFYLKSQSLILYDFFTLIEHRNKGYYQKLLYLITQENKKKYIFIYTTILNINSIKAILKSGFEIKKLLNFFSKKIIQL